MPNIFRITSPFIPGSGNPDSAYETVSTVPGAYIPYAPGDLGNSFAWGTSTYQKVLMGSGINTSASGQLLFWKDKSLFSVTNVGADALLAAAANSFRNNVAGLCRGVVPAGAQFFMMTHGRAVRVLEAGSATGGMTLVANTGTAADALGVAIATAPTCQPLGPVVTATSASACTANFDITNGG